MLDTISNVLKKYMNESIGDFTCHAIVDVVKSLVSINNSLKIYV